MKKTYMIEREITTKSLKENIFIHNTKLDVISTLNFQYKLGIVCDIHEISILIAHFFYRKRNYHLKKI